MVINNINKDMDVSCNITASVNNATSNNNNSNSINEITKNNLKTVSNL